MLAEPCSESKLVHVHCVGFLTLPTIGTGPAHAPDNCTGLLGADGVNGLHHEGYSFCLALPSPIWTCLGRVATADPGASASGNFSLARDADDLRGRIGLNLHHQRLVPGAAPPDSKTASKNAKKRNRNKVPVSEVGDALCMHCHCREPLQFEAQLPLPPPL